MVADTEDRSPVMTRSELRDHLKSLCPGRGDAANLARSAGVDPHRLYVFFTPTSNAAPPVEVLRHLKIVHVNAKASRVKTGGEVIKAVGYVYESQLAGVLGERELQQV